MIRDDMFGLLNSMLRSAVEKNEKPEDVRTKIDKYVEFIGSNKLAEKTDIDAFAIVSDNLIGLLGLYSSLAEKGVGIEIFPERNPNRKIGFK